MRDHRTSLFMWQPADTPKEHVDIVRAAKSDRDPEDGYTPARDPKSEETKITWFLVRDVLTGD